MEADRVRSIAAEMGMKKAESADRQEAEYFILDNQAITSAKEIAEKSVAQPKKRGRKPKKQQPAATPVAAAEETATDGQEATAAEQQPKKAASRNRRTWSNPHCSMTRLPPSSPKRRRTPTLPKQRQMNRSR